MNTCTVLALAALVLSTTAVSAQLNRTDQGNTFTYGQKTYPVGPQIAPRNPDLYKPYPTVTPYSPPAGSPSKNSDRNINRPFGQ
jgi:hypothetical protein